MARSLAIVVLVSACGGGDGGGGLDFPPAILEDSAEMARFAAGTSAPSLYLQGLVPISVADARLDIDMETCPVKTVTGDVTTYEGGCTTSRGEAWVGRATVTGSAQGAGDVVYEGFGASATDACNGAEYPSAFAYDGTLTFSGGPPVLTWSARLAIRSSGPDETDACAPREVEVGVAYDGTIRQGTRDADQDGEIDDTTWEGRGQVGNSFLGLVDAATAAEVIDDVACDDEALSGSTTARAGGHAITIVYDGATDCSPDSTVRWQYDGQDRGELTGVACSAGGSSGGALLLIGAALLARRRRRG